MKDVWLCKVGGSDIELPDGADFPMRIAILKAYKEVTGKEAEFLFSGWGAKLDKYELAVLRMRSEL
jgi:hypothetical protein